MPERNKELIEEHLRKCAALPSEPGEVRLKTIATRMKTVAKLIDKPLDSLQEKDLQTLNLKMRERGMVSAPYYRKALKQFLKLRNKKLYIDLIDSPYLATPRKKANGRKLVDPEKFWSQEEIDRYIAESVRYSKRQAAWAVVWLGSGARPHELLESLRKKDLVCEQNCLIIKIRQGKTGARSIILPEREAVGIWYYAEPYLETLKENDILFNYSYQMAARIHRKVCKRAKIGEDKDWNFYVARKMALSRFYNEEGAVKASLMAGHTPGGNTMKYYCSMSEAEMRKNTQARVQNKPCPNPACGFVGNEPHQGQCSKCGSPLDREKYKAVFEANMSELIDLKLQAFKQQMEIKMLEGKKKEN